MPAKAPPSLVLRVDEHRRDSAGLTYVYPVVSRRAGGVSVGINLNVNNACNWRCVYCQVPDLRRGGPPPVDLTRLDGELRGFLAELQTGSFMRERVPEDARRIVDVAFSGNGEPTSSAEFAAAVRIVVAALGDAGLAAEVKIRLITNGSLVDRAHVQEGIAEIGRAGGEVWFKVDAVGERDLARINGVRPKPAAVERRLRRSAVHCETWVQTCMFASDGVPPEEAEVAAYLDFLVRCREAIAGVHLYTLARQPMQPAGARLEALPAAWLEGVAARIMEKGLTVRVSP